VIAYSMKGVRRLRDKAELPGPKFVEEDTSDRAAGNFISPGD